MMKTKKLMMVALVSSTLALSGCGAMSTAIKKRNLEVKTQMSETIWLEPASERTVMLPPCVRAHQVRKFRPVLRQVTSINTRPVWSQMRTRLT